jgi:hypothetical protein
MSIDITRIHVSSFKNPYQEIPWLFTRVTGQENMKTISRLALYIFHFTIHEKTIFDWGKITSIEIASLLSNFKKEKKFFKASYFILSITYFHMFKGLTISKRVDCKIKPITRGGRCRGGRGGVLFEPGGKRMLKEATQRQS